MTGAAAEQETWWLPSPDGEGTLILGAHPRGRCSGRACALHAPSAHWAGGMPMRWRYDPAEKVGRMERLCPHGYWHDDPDDRDFRVRSGLPVPWLGYRRDCDCPCDCDHEAPF